jgi:F-type H+-transporting ATPase subunit gamma
MANLKEIRNRIVSIDSTKQITNAMKMVSAAKLKKAQDSITQMRPYAEKLQELLQNISGTLEGNVGGEYTKQRTVENVLLVVFSSNKGLCGGYNSSVLKEVTKLIQNEYKGKKVTLITIGKKATQSLGKLYKIESSIIEIVDKPSFEDTVSLAEGIIQSYLNYEFDKVVLVYNHFRNAGTQIVITEQALPVELKQSEAVVNMDYIFEPDKEEIITDLIPKTLRMQFFKALLDSIASEHGARMTAMHKATDNANDLLNELKLGYNKARQAAITTEILEIVGGAAALDG